MGEQENLTEENVEELKAHLKRMQKDNPDLEYRFFKQQEGPTNVKEARKIMADSFKEDPDFRQGYVANIAMLIYDDQMAGAESRSNGPPTCLSTVEGCNSIADRILTLIFD